MQPIQTVEIFSDLESFNPKNGKYLRVVALYIVVANSNSTGERLRGGPPAKAVPTPATEQVYLPAAEHWSTCSTTAHPHVGGTVFFRKHMGGPAST